MSKIIYIAGLGHSGTTILDMSLGTLPCVTGLGELKTIMDDKTREKHYTSLCSCGKTAKDCEIWKEVPNLLKGKSNEGEKIESILDFVKSKYGADSVLVDSSKNSYAYLKYLTKNHDLTILYLTRDVRSWSYSRSLSTKKPVLYFMLRWYLENKKLLVSLKKMGLKIHTLGYEELSLYPDHLLKIIAKKTGLKYSDSMLEPDKTRSHIISGNVARIDKEKRSGWFYDARWLISSRILLLSPFTLLLQRLNRKLVYSNINGSSIKNFYLFGTKKKEELSKNYN